MNDRCETCGKQFPTNAWDVVMGLSYCPICGHSECGECLEQCRIKETENDNA